MKNAHRMLRIFILAVFLTPPVGAVEGGRWLVFAAPGLTDLSLSGVSGHREYRMGFLVGAGYEIPMSYAASLSVQALYTTGGTHVDTNESSDMTYKGNAVVLPILLRIKTGRGAAPFLTAGGYAGWMFSPSLERDTKDSSSEAPISGADVRPFHYGLVGGAGFDFHLGSTSMFVDVLYSHGLSNLAKSGTGKVRPSALNLRVGVRI